MLVLWDGFAWYEEGEEGMPPDLRKVVQGAQIERLLSSLRPEDAQRRLPSATERLRRKRESRQAAARLYEQVCSLLRSAAPLFLVAALLAACAPRVPVYPAVPQPGELSDSAIAAAGRSASLVVLAEADTDAVDPFFSASFQLGSRDIWWHVRLRVAEVIKGRTSRARHVEYGLGPALTPPIQPFSLGPQDIIVQRALRWETAPVDLHVRRVYFLRQCYNCAPLPARTSRARVFASPWFAMLALPEADAERAFRLVR